MTETQKPTPKTPFDDPPADNGLVQLKSSQTLVTVATIAGPVSLLFGGVLLSTVGVVCAILAAVKVRRVVAAGITPGLGVYASRIQRSAVLSLFICILALTLNAIALASVLPVMMQALETGDLSSLYEAYNLPQGSGSVAGSDSAGSGSSAWG